MNDMPSVDEELAARDWRPSLRDLETIAIMRHAGAPLGNIAKAVGCPEQFLRAWFVRLEAGRDAEQELAYEEMRVFKAELEARARG